MEDKTELARYEKKPQIMNQQIFSSKHYFLKILKSADRLVEADTDQIAAKIKGRVVSALIRDGFLCESNYNPVTPERSNAKLKINNRIYESEIKFLDKDIVKTLFGNIFQDSKKEIQQKDHATKDQNTTNEKELKTSNHRVTEKDGDIQEKATGEITVHEKTPAALDSDISVLYPDVSDVREYQCDMKESDFIYTEIDAKMNNDSYYFVITPVCIKENGPAAALIYAEYEGKSKCICYPMHWTEQAYTFGVFGKKFICESRFENRKYIAKISAINTENTRIRSMDHNSLFPEKGGHMAFVYNEKKIHLVPLCGLSGVGCPKLIVCIESEKGYKAFSGSCDEPSADVFLSTAKHAQVKMEENEDMFHVTIVIGDR